MHVVRRALVCFAAVQCICPGAFAQGPWPLLARLSSPPAPAAERLPIRIYTTAEGLAHDDVTRIVKDSRGFLWFCTADGLSRFDGYSFVNFGVEQGLPHPRVNDFLEARDGTYWVATNAGTVRFDPRGRPGQTDGGSGGAAMFTTVPLPDGTVRERAVNVLREAKDGAIWVGSQDGLFRLRRDGARGLERIDVGIPRLTAESRTVSDVLEDRRGAIWIATPVGLFMRRPDGTALRFTAADGMPSENLSDLLEDSQGRLWAGSRLGGFFQFDLSGEQGTDLVVGDKYSMPALPANWVFQMFEAADGRFWLGTARGLVEFLAPKDGHAASFSAHSVRNGLSYYDITALAEDPGGNLWLATNRAGVMRLARNGFTSYGERDGIAQVNAVFDGGGDGLCVRGSLLPGEAAGADYLRAYGCFDGRSFRWFVPKAVAGEGWVTERITLRTRAGEWWIGTGTGVYRFSAGSSFMDLARGRPAVVYTPDDGLASWQAFRLFEDRRGNVWIATIDSITNGLARWEPATGKLRNLAGEQGLPPLDDELPRAFAEDESGQVWIGFNAGLARYANGRFTYFTARDGLPRGSVMDIHVDAAGRVWFASSASGLVRVDGASTARPAFVTYTMAQGFSSNNTEVLTEDLAGHIYVGGGRGLDRLDPETGRLKHFTTADGLPRGSFRAAYRDPRGALWFGTSTGLGRLVPAAEDASAPPSVLIRAIRVASIPHLVSAVGETEVSLPDLGSAENPLEIDFGGLNFRIGETLRYRYRLEGADAAWSAPSERRSVTYASLRPNSYRFVVQAVDSDGVVSTQPAAVSFTILQPVWRRWWFLCLVGLAVAGAAHAAHRYRVARLLDIANMRTRIATDLHDDIGANLTRIALLTEVAKRPGEAEVDTHLASIARIARESVSSMSDIVWAINPARETLLDLTRRLRAHAEEVFTLRDIDLRFHSAGIREGLRLGVDVRRDLLLIFKEAVNNAARHSDCSRVDIQLTLSGSRLSLTVADNGRGFDVGHPDEGQGLASMARRARRLGGALEILPAPGGGTIVKADVTL